MTVKEALEEFSHRKELYICNHGTIKFTDQSLYAYFHNDFGYMFKYDDKEHITPLLDKEIERVVIDITVRPKQYIIMVK